MCLRHRFEAARTREIGSQRGTCFFVSLVPKDGLYPIELCGVECLRVESLDCEFKSNLTALLDIVFDRNLPRDRAEHNDHVGKTR